MPTKPTAAVAFTCSHVMAKGNLKTETSFLLQVNYRLAGKPVFEYQTSGIKPPRFTEMKSFDAILIQCELLVVAGGKTIAIQL